MNRIQTWLVAARPFSFPATVIPVAGGSLAAAAATPAGFAWMPFLVALAAMLLLHSGVNMRSDAADFLVGIDRDAHPASGAVVRGLLTPAQARRGGMFVLACGALLGLSLVPRVGPELLALGAAGGACGLAYPRLKRHTLGDAAVLTAFGLLGSLGGWAVQTGGFAWAPLLWGLPPGLLVAAILHANNWRDAAADRAAGIRTVAGRLGPRGALYYYAALMTLPYALVPLLVALPAPEGRLPATTLLTAASLPAAILLVRRARRGALRALDASTAQLNLLFGALYLLGFVLDIAV
ncbi:prenyltransferase [Kiritimatiella glycovorans]|uniref:1,4-dihydroxy-2-naphthoate octaprenyltransferase n=1 Tax=Kiritimatiella glycovorans TaxID=1307763 RepID=A0A0G3ED49_9BACT|nr:prenyltransferase [Kiritimatiella glycovorans]AKJ63302.1 1,4-dihydroxy-2-naphthoate octaprenyltransferase [Kiritimatiella glycovorans]